MKKKKIFFVINNLNVGGAEKALISLLHAFDYNEYEVDLQLFKKEGLFIKQLPAEVNLLPVPENYKYFDMSFKQVVKENVFRNWNVILRRIQFKFNTQKGKTVSESSQLGWRSLSKTIKPLLKEYDVAIGYLQNSPNYFVVDKVKAKKKIGFIHTNYSASGMDSAFDYPYFSKLDYIATVSDQCLKVLNEVFPEFRSKIKLVPNMISPGLIKQQAQTDINLFEKYPATVKLLSVGRLESVKGYDLAIKACKILVEKGYDVNWFVLGEGQLRKELELLIEQSGLQQHFYLLGIDTNPYQYMQQADVVVHSARFEGYGLVVAEAKILQKPIVATNFNCVSEQIEDNKNGLICEMNAEDIAEKIELLIKNNNLKNKLINYLKDKSDIDYKIKEFHELLI